MRTDPVRVRMLLVDDDEDDFVITREMLSGIPNAEFEVDWAATGEAGLAAIAAKRPDVCLVDYRMGEHNGLDFMRWVVERGFDVPIVMMTGHGDRQVEVEAMRIGAAGYLVKGEMRPALLEWTLHHAIDRARRKKLAEI